MADNIEEIQKSVRTYFKVGIILIVGTIATVALSYYEMPTHGMNILAGMILATIKAAFVAYCFMHLGHEKSTIYKILAFTAVFAFVLFVLFYFSNVEGLIHEGMYDKLDD